MLDTSMAGSVEQAFQQLQKVAQEIGASVSFDGTRFIMIIPSSKIKEMIFKNADNLMKSVTEVECSDVVVKIDFAKLIQMIASFTGR